MLRMTFATFLLAIREIRRHLLRSFLTLSLIHISEPTRPY